MGIINKRKEKILNRELKNQYKLRKELKNENKYSIINQ